MWTRREIENYFTSREVLMRWVGNKATADLFSMADRDREIAAMNQAIGEISSAQRLAAELDIWSDDAKASDQVLDPIFRRYFQILGRPLEFRKSSYSDLVGLLTPDEVDPEVTDKLDQIVALSERARPAQ